MHWWQQQLSYTGLRTQEGYRGGQVRRERGLGGRGGGGGESGKVTGLNGRDTGLSRRAALIQMRTSLSSFGLLHMQ